ncbi:MAG TPA: circadian clock KaiB family protein [Planctomycetota bacterium]|nr:circadian clock KaiB family protein [Planctomycetota bacterium]
MNADASDDPGARSSPDARSGDVRFQLYVAGHSPKSLRAIANLRRICDEHLEGKASFVVVDVVEHPELAEMHRIHVLPTLVRESPPPKRRISGDLSDAKRVLTTLKLDGD